ncbi:hypothetical protein GCM10018965_076210 [Nonomuraea roseola]
MRSAVLATVVSASLLNATSASAAVATFTSGPPTQSTGVGTLKEKSIGNKKLQLRTGKWNNGKYYIWARLTNISSGKNLSIYVTDVASGNKSSNGVYYGSGNTIYGKATRLLGGNRLYEACHDPDNMPGGSAAICVGWLQP